MSDTVRHYELPNGASLQGYMANGHMPRVKFVGHSGDVLIATLGHVGAMSKPFTRDDLAKLVDDMWAKREFDALPLQVWALMQFDDK